MQKSYKLFCSQVSGKQPKLLSKDETIILKSYCQKQYNFYMYANSLIILNYAFGINSFIPKFKGTLNMDVIPIIQSNQKVKDQKTLQWLEHLKQRYEVRNPQNKFILLENIVKKYKRPNIIDIKLGIRDVQKVLKSNKKKIPSKHSFKLNGCKIEVRNHQQNNHERFETLFFSKYFFKTLKVDDDLLLEHIALYFFDGYKIRIQLLRRMKQKLRQLILQAKSLVGWTFYSTSICLFYDVDNQSLFQVKLLDFGRSNLTENRNYFDKQSMVGLQNFHKFLMKIQNKAHQIEQNLLKLKLKYLQEVITIIPEEKIKEYQLSSRQTSQFNSPQKPIFQEKQKDQNVNIKIKSAQQLNNNV